MVYAICMYVCMHIFFLLTKSLAYLVKYYKENEVVSFVIQVLLVKRGSKLGFLIVLFLIINLVKMKASNIYTHERRQFCEASYFPPNL